MAGKKASMTTQPRWRATTNDKSVWQMMKATTKRARAARAMVMEKRVPGSKEGKGVMGHGISNKGGMRQRG